MNWKNIFRITPKRLLIFLSIFIILQFVPVPVYPCTVGSPGVSVTDAQREYSFGFCPGSVMTTITGGGPAYNVLHIFFDTLILSFLIMLVFLIIQNKQ